MTLTGSWSSTDVTAQCEKGKRNFFLVWRRALGLNGEPDTRPFGEGCCGLARAKGELIPGFPAEGPLISRPKELS